jgi:hypothetical protein
MAKKLYTMNGYNADIDAGSEDLHPGGGDMFFATAAATTTVVSSDVNDDGNPVGTGARTIRVVGLDANDRIKSETATMNGTSVVTLTTEFKRVWYAEVMTFGSGLANAGTIDVKHSSDILCRIAIGANRSEHASFTAPSKLDFPQCHIKHIYGSLMNAPTSGIVVFNLLTRKSGEPWKTRAKFATYSTASVAVNLDVDISLEPGEDVKLRGTATVNNSEVAGGLHILLGSYSEAMTHP